MYQSLYKAVGNIWTQETANIMPLKKNKYFRFVAYRPVINTTMYRMSVNSMNIRIHFRCHHLVSL